MPGTLLDKLWDSHCIETDDNGESLLYIDRIVLHERTGALALQALRDRGRRVRRPEHAFCVTDHIIDTRPGRGDETQAPGGEAFILRQRQGAAHFGLRLFDIQDADQGISHLVSAEQGIALPGLALVCPDSHTCTLGAIGTLALGIGSTEAEHVLATSTLRISRPDSLLVRVSGALQASVSSKDLALQLIAEHGADGGKGTAVEFAGDAINALHPEARMTLCNMAVEFGALTALIAPDAAVHALVANSRYAPRRLPLEDWRRLCSEPDADFARVIEIDANQVQHRITWGTSPAQGVALRGRVPTPASDADARALAYIGLAPGARMTDVTIDAAFIGSCTNARLSDLRAAAEVLRNRRVAPGVAALCVPGSGRVKRAAEAEGLDQVFRAAGFEWREAGCSLCFYAGGESFGPGKRIASTTNRNFEGRQGPGARSHLASPAVVAASAVRGRLSAPDML